MKQKLTCKSQKVVMLGGIALSAILLLIVAGMTALSSFQMFRILDESVSSQLISISLAAREHIDTEAFERYSTNQDRLDDLANYNRTLAALRLLAEDVGADYIYALKEVDGEYVFVFDTDEEDTEVFIPYDISAIHQEAFRGYEVADTMNVDDAYGSFNTGAVPIVKDGRVLGIICTDIRDVYMQQSQQAAVRNLIILVVVLVVFLGVILVVVNRLYANIRQMNQNLQQLANYDTVTGLPNRQFLLEYLERKTIKEDKPPFALLFIDLDNFKSVNDNAGHDAGDALLQHIANFLKGSQENSMSFRPTAGQLNIAARIGGDEFIQVVSGIENEEQAAALARKLLEDFQQKAKNRNVEKFNVGLSIGVALYPLHTENYHILIKYADTAMYEAKQAGKNDFRVYSDEMTAEN